MRSTNLDEIAKRLSAAGRDVSRCALEAVAPEGCRDQTPTLFQVSEAVRCVKSAPHPVLRASQIPQEHGLGLPACDAHDFAVRDTATV